MIDLLFNIFKWICGISFIILGCSVFLGIEIYSYTDNNKLKKAFDYVFYGSLSISVFAFIIMLITSAITYFMS